MWHGSTMHVMAALPNMVWTKPAVIVRKRRSQTHLF